MKKINIIFIALFSIILFSCESDKTENKKETKIEAPKQMKSLTNSQIGSEENGKLKLFFNEEQLLQVAREFILLNDLDIEPEYVNILEIDQKKYLRIYSKNDFVSTVELLLNTSTSTYWTGNTVCTSSQCASEGGCLPNGDYCTECRTGVDGNLKGDCKRSTAGATSNTGLNPNP